jgi:hypothetical protein
MSCPCKHLIINTTKTVKQGVAVQGSNYHCALKRASRTDTKIINDAFQKQTLISVAGYTCYYYGNKALKCQDCVKFEQGK